MTDTVRIAGAGVAGLALAIRLARAGGRVEVFDRRERGRGRFAGGWQVLENGSRLEDALVELDALGDHADCTVIPVHRATFLDGYGKAYEVSSEKPYTYFILRGGDGGSLDRWLLRLAVDAGVIVHDQTKAPENVDVIAIGPAQADGIAHELVFTSNLPDTVMVLFDPTVTPSGYAYLFCHGGHATFGVALVRFWDQLKKARELAWERFRQHLGTFSVEHPIERGQFMNFSLPGSLRTADGRWYAGEAAGVQDFLYGLGNRLALRSAALVADGVLGRWDEGAFRRQILTPMRTSVSLRWGYERLGRRGFAAFCAMAANRDFRELLLFLQRPRRLTRLFSRLAMTVWRERNGCRHSTLCSWCRRHA